MTFENITESLMDDHKRFILNQCERVEQERQRCQKAEWEQQRQQGIRDHLQKIATTPPEEPCSCDHTRSKHISVDDRNNPTNRSEEIDHYSCGFCSCVNF